MLNISNRYADLEVKDPESKLTRFILPGKKIISIKLSNFKTVANVKIYESRRVQLATLTADLKKLDKPTGSTLFIPANRIGQDWDLLAARRRFPLQTEYIATRSSKDCAGQAGIKGHVWRVYDYRNDYDVKFLVAGTSKVWGELIATGQHQTQTEEVDLAQCTQKITIHNQPKEAYQ